GDYATATALIDEAIAVFRDIGPGALLWYLGMAALLRAVQGQADAARACMDEIESLLAAVPEGTMPTGEPLAYLSETALVLGDRDRLARYYPRLLPLAGQFNDFLIDRLLGSYETVQDDWPA